MTMLTSPTLQFTNAIAPTISPKPPHSKPSHIFTTRAVDPETDPSAAEAPSQGAAADDGDSFESRLAQVRLRYRSGAGKKAEARRGKKSKKESSEGGVFLPPVPLVEPVSGGLKVEVGFSPYTERLNGRLAALGLAALLLVELGSGTSLVKYHSPAVVFVQVYFVAAVGALYVKYEKERVSVWPQ